MQESYQLVVLTKWMIVSPLLLALLSTWLPIDVNCNCKILITVIQKMHVNNKLVNKYCEHSHCFTSVCYCCHVQYVDTRLG